MKVAAFAMIFKVSGNMEMRRKTKSIIFSPDWSDGGNPYQSLLAASLQRLGYRVTLENFPVGRRFPLFDIAKNNPDASVIHIHWINNYIENLMWSRSNTIFMLKCFGILIDCFLVKRLGVRLVWTVHNKVSHESRNEKREIAVRRLLASQVHQLVFHSKPALFAVEALYGMRLRHKAAVVPHGNYDGVYKVDETITDRYMGSIRAIEDVGNRPLVFLFFGAIRPYKGLESLIHSFRSSKVSGHVLLIAGRPASFEYEQSILELARDDPRIICQLRFIGDEEVGSLFGVADYVVLPFVNTLTSGSVVLALTHGKALILPRHADVLGLPDSGAIWYSCEFGLQKAMQMADRACAEQMGRENRIFADGLSWERISVMMGQVYSAP